MIHLDSPSLANTRSVFKVNTLDHPFEIRQESTSALLPSRFTVMLSEAGWRVEQILAHFPRI